MYSAAYQALGGDPAAMHTTERALKVIRQGLPVSMLDEATRTLGANRADIASLIGTTVRSIQRKKATDPLTPQQSEHTLAIVSVYASAADYFGDRDKARLWMQTPQVIFGNQTAFSYLDTMTGIEFVSDVLTRMKYGMTA